MKNLRAPPTTLSDIVRKNMLATFVIGVTLIFITVVSASDGDSQRDHWAFQLPQSHPLPQVANTAWTKNPIDRFILARLEAAGLRPAPEATPGDLRRRYYFDLIGLPPPPEHDVQDLSSLIEELLASPHYGERWGRHWLDVVRYADSNGLDENAAHANAWRYRDYVINSFNADRPFDQFLTMQLAGDLLAAEDDAQRREQLVATGFLSLGPKLLAEPDKLKLEMDIIDEQIDTIGQALLGMTLGCARCHDHKFDPIPTTEYYALAGIFKSTKTMESLQTIAKWHENSVATPELQKLWDQQAALVDAQNKVIKELVDEANQELQLAQQLEKLPEKPETHYPEATRQELEKLRARLKELESAAPKLPTAMGVVEGSVTNLPVFLRGDPRDAGEVQPRRLPKALLIGAPKPFNDDTSGRLELARWIASRDNPLTARVIVNRVWRWHFGQGLVSTPDNFGQLGARATHPKLLDWLATWFVDHGWSVKKLNRLILGSATYAMSSEVSPEALARDPTNRLYSRAPLRRLEAEPLRDTLLELGGLLDKSVGGKVWTFGNYQLVFNHESKDATTYDSNRRTVYLPIIRNNVYSLLELFDFPAPDTVSGHRTSTVISPQALFLMNSPLVLRSTRAMAKKLLANEQWDDARRVRHLYASAYTRSPADRETERALEFVRTFAAARDTGDAREGLLAAWQALCQATVSANEFMYLR